MGLFRLFVALVADVAFDDVADDVADGPSLLPNGVSTKHDRNTVHCRRRSVYRTVVTVVVYALLVRYNILSLVCSS